MTWVVKLSGKKDYELNLRPARVGPIWAAPSRSRESSSVLGRLGLVSSSLGAGGEKRLPMTWRLSATVANRRSRLDELYRWLDGLLEVEFSDSPGRVYLAHLDQAATQSAFDAAEFVNGQLQIPVELIMDTPAGLSKGVSSVGVGTHRAFLPLGTLPSEPTFYIPGAWTDLLIQYFHGLTEELLAALQLEGSADSSSITIIDAENEEIWVWDTATGALVDGIATGLYGEGSFPVFDPGDGTHANPPFVTCSVDGEARWREAYK